MGIGCFAVVVCFLLIVFVAFGRMLWELTRRGAGGLALGLAVLVPMAILLWLWSGAIRVRWIRRHTSIVVDEELGSFRFRGFRERVGEQVTKRVAERVVPGRSIRAVRRTSHGPDWNTTVVWVDDDGEERQVLVDRDDPVRDRLAEMIALRLGLTVESRND